MKNAITTLRIQNFKSIKDVEMTPRRVNIIIGEPNVGKSNILEAMSLLGAGLYEENTRFLGEVLRYETVSNLFYDNDTGHPVTVEASTGNAILAADERDNGHYRFVQISDEWWRQYKAVVKEQGEGVVYLSEKKTTEEALQQLAALELGDNRMMSALNQKKVQDSNFAYVQVKVRDNGDKEGFRTHYHTPAALPKKYVYRFGQPHNQSSRYAFLQPPLGHNLLSIVQKSPALRREMAALFKPYGLSLVLRVGERKFEIQKQVEDLVYKYLAIIKWPIFGDA